MWGLPGGVETGRWCHLLPEEQDKRKEDKAPHLHSLLVLLPGSVLGLWQPVDGRWGTPLFQEGLFGGTWLFQDVLSGQVGVTEDYPLRSTPCQMLVKEGSFPLTHSLDSPLFPKTGWDPMHPYWGVMVTDSGHRGGRREEVK